MLRRGVDGGAGGRGLGACPKVGEHGCVGEHGLGCDARICESESKEGSVEMKGSLHQDGKVVP